MLLIYTQKITPRISYVFRHVCTRILGLEVQFTSSIEAFISEEGPKISYNKQQLGNEFYIQSSELLTQQGFESIDILMKNWEDTKCFFPLSDKSHIPFDIFAASFYLLSRYEEYLPHVKDQLGRFPASESLGYKEGFLQQPVVDIWAYKFRAILASSFPQMVFPNRKMQIHNLVNAMHPFAYMEKGFFRNLVGFSKDSIKFRIRKNFQRTKVLLGLKKDPFNTFEWVVDTVKDSRFPLTVFFMLGNADNYNEGISFQKKNFKSLIKQVGDYCRVGLVFSSSSLDQYTKLKKEKEQLEAITNKELLQSTNGLFLVNLPDFYRNLVELEIESDFTMVYHDTPGFRAGTCSPFLFYDLDYEVKTPLIVHPIAATSESFSTKSSTQTYDMVEGLIKSVAAVNGMFSIFLSNTDFVPTKQNRVWRRIFSEKLQE